MKILISGICGHMGKEVEKLAVKGYGGAELAAGVDFYSDGTASVPCAKSFEDAYKEVDCVIDFSNHTCTQKLLDFVCENRLPLVLATTGQTDEERKAIAEAAKKIPIFFAANYSLGVALLIELAKKTAAALPDAEIEIIEKHHTRKLDAPSGTALSIARAIESVRGDMEFKCGRSGSGKRSKNEIGIHSLRMGNIVGEHEVLVCTENQMISLKHEAYSRALFAEGALCAAKFIIGKPCGLYDMKDILNFDSGEGTDI